MQPGDVGFLQVAGAEVGAQMPVCQQKPQRLRPGFRVRGGQLALQLRALVVAGEFAPVCGAGS
jgi:hypothetical protein